MWERIRELGIDFGHSPSCRSASSTRCGPSPSFQVFDGSRRSPALSPRPPSPRNDCHSTSARSTSATADARYRRGGILGQEKAWIAQGVQARAADYGLRTDVAWSEAARIYGQSWFDFIGSCRVTLGTESGATITDFDGSIERQTIDHLERQPGADFWKVHGAVLAPFEGNVRMNV